MSHSQTWPCMGIVLTLAALSFATTSSALAADADSAAKPKKILYLTHSQGFNHSVLGLSEKIIAEMGKKSGAFEATCLKGYAQDAKAIDMSFLTEEYLNQFDGLMLYTTGELPLYYWQTEAIKAFVKNGKAIIGIHAATDTFYKWPEFMNIMGANFKTHGCNDKVVHIKVEDPNHPATKMLDKEWVIADEMYQFRAPVDRSKFRVLLSVDPEATPAANLEAHKMRRGEAVEVAWCREYGKGRVFYTSLGHRDDVWENPTYQAHLLAGIRWALGDLPGDATPTEPRKAGDKP